MRRVLACSLVVLLTLLVAPAVADHVSAAPQVSARLGDRLSDNAWGVVVDWSINCSGPAPGDANYTGSLNLDDVDTGEVLYMGGTSSASGTDVAPVERRAQPRRMRPRLKASCFDGGIGNHGSDTVEVTGNVVLVPAKGDENGDGVPDGGGGGGTTPPPGGSPPPTGDPLPPAGGGGACAARKEGTRAGETLDGTSAGDRLLGLGGNDLLRGLSGNDCLDGGAGRDRLLGGPGHDRLDGGRGADRLTGGAGTDRLTGGAGADRLAGGPGNNRYIAGPGNDVVSARNGRAEVVSCGPGRDRARVDRRDFVRSCERVRRG